MRNEIRFLLGDQPRALRSVDPTMTVLDYLRQVEGLTGTKEGCNEGDCGACTVVIARPKDGNLRYQSVNACIQFVGTLDGCQLLTVEHLANGERLHPIQQAMVDWHGSQCGFCTPGFVMSMFALSRTSDAPVDDNAINDVLAGNLCRCTGYAPIVRAATAMYEGNPRSDHIQAAVGSTLETLQSLDDGEDIIVSGPGNRLFCAPASIANLTAALGGHPQATISAGSTDVGLWVTKDLHRPNVVIYTGRVRELQAIGETNGEITIGAAVTYTDAMDRLAAYFRDMGEVIRRIGSLQIRNAGTVGGNVANGSPIGDMPPMLIAAGARVHLMGSAGERSMPMEDFFIEYGKQDRRSGEIVEKITIPIPDETVRFRAYKISKRFDQDISAVLGAFSLRLEGGAVTEARLAYGGMAGTPKRASAAEEALKGQPWNESAVQAAMRAMENDFTPLSDWRASAGYRMAVAKNLLMRAYLETTEPSVETRLVGIPA